MNVRYFAAARAAAGVDEERFDLADGDTLADLLEAILAVERPEPPAGTPPLARILSRSSFLLNEVAVRDQQRGAEAGRRRRRAAAVRRRLATVRRQTYCPGSPGPCWAGARHALPCAGPPSCVSWRPGRPARCPPRRRRRPRP